MNTSYIIARAQTSRVGHTRRRLSGLVVASLVILHLPSLVLGQTNTPAPKPAVPETVAPLTRDESTDITLESLQRAIQANSAERVNVRQQIINAVDDDLGVDLAEKLQSLRAENEELLRKFETIATGAVTAEFAQSQEDNIELQVELTRLLLPIVSELKEATSASREKEFLRRSISQEARRHELAVSASERAAQLAAATTNAPLVERLNKIADSWAQKAQTKEAELSALRYELAERNANKKSILATTQKALQRFISTRGRNLALATLTFVVVLFIFRFAGRKLILWMEQRSDGSRFGIRLVHLVSHIFSILAAIIALLMSLNATGDWFLLGIVLLFLTGAAWGMMKTLPNIYEQLKLVLNLGAVRENELILFDGVPWKVKSLGFMAQLVNPALDGGHVDLPIRELVGHHSRIMGTKEPLFPTEQDDWVLLNDTTHAKVLTQTPSIVEILELGGARTAMPTAEFLSLHPVNLSHNYRVRVTFGVDYAHQAICTTEIPTLMQSFIAKRIATEFPNGDLINLDVQFLNAAASSLDYTLIADMTGSSAAHYRAVRRALSRFAVDACNEYGWVIPFTQLTLHQAPAPTSS
ncbi:MAG: hypothetical protein OSB41_01985 [Kiritimatiellae bacterium]|nr:hypothetical protein [Kiritimatiellia bacterium]